MNSSAADVQSEQWSQAVWCSGFGATQAWRGHSSAIHCQCDRGLRAASLSHCSLISKREMAALEGTL